MSDQGDDHQSRERMPLLRVPRQERYYSTEDVLGRDAADVFPSETRKAMLESDAVQQMFKNKKFISQTELDEIKQATGGRGRVEDGSVAADKPLAVILQERKEAKEAEFQEKWKQIKTGKNRPLDEEELQFLDGIAEAEAARIRHIEDEEKKELDAFHRALQNQQEERALEIREANERKRAIRGDTTNTNHSTAGLGSSQQQSGSKKARATSTLPVKVVVKKKKVSHAEEEKKESSPKDKGNAGGDLGGLLGEYGSDEE